MAARGLTSQSPKPNSISETICRLLPIKEAICQLPPNILVLNSTANPSSSLNKAGPTVSVVVPVFNRQDSITGCLESIAGQTLPVSEIIIVDDGSTDASVAEIEKWIAAQRSQTKYLLIKQQNQGKSAALNSGVGATSSEWIAFNDSDDFWLPHKLEAQFKLLEQESKTLVCVSDSRFINDPNLTDTNFQIRGFDKILTKQGRLKDTFQVLAKDPNGIFMQSLIAHRSCIEQVFPLDPSLRVAQDIDLIFRLSLTSDFSFILEPLVEIDRTPTRADGLTKQHDMKSLYRLRTKERILEQWLKIPDNRLKMIHPLIRHNLANTQNNIAANLAENGDLRQAMYTNWQALKNHRNAKNLVRWLLPNLKKI